MEFHMAGRAGAFVRPCDGAIRITEFRARAVGEHLAVDVAQRLRCWFAVRDGSDDFESAKAKGRQGTLEHEQRIGSLAKRHGDGLIVKAYLMPERCDRVEGV